MSQLGIPYPTAADASLGDPVSLAQTHPPAICNNAESCDARNYCGHARVHEHELMFDKCAGHWCSFALKDVKCVEPTDGELKTYLFAQKTVDTSART